jgi:hypothetical protein
LKSGEAHFGISTAKTAVLDAQAWSARLTRVKRIVTARADIVGSLLRPRELLEAVDGTL